MWVSTERIVHHAPEMIGVGGFVRYAGASLDLPVGAWRHADRGSERRQAFRRPSGCDCDSEFGLMRILMIAPEPFFEPRGTPFSEYHRIRALLDLGHTVDLVTYPFGSDVNLAGLRIFRAARPPFITRVRIGPSPAKVFLDMTLTVTALNRARQERYDAVHSHEEGAAIGVLISSILGIPHLYDMHSSLPQQLENFAFSRSVGSAVDVSGARAYRDQAVARDHRYLPASGGDSEESCSRRSHGAHRERAWIGRYAGRG